LRYRWGYWVPSPCWLHITVHSGHDWLWWWRQDDCPRIDVQLWSDWIHQRKCICAGELNSFFQLSYHRDISSAWTLMDLVFIIGCNRYWWCVQKWWGCQPCNTRARWQDNPSTWTNSRNQHQNYLFSRSRWLENCKFSLINFGF
jgi:hypothetical protein